MFSIRYYKICYIINLWDSQTILSTIAYRNFTQILLEKHKIAIAEMINRDKNRACVIMWSVANEPRTSEKSAGPYFGYVSAMLSV